MSDLEKLPPKTLSIHSKIAAPTASYVPSGRPRVPKDLSTDGKKVFNRLCQLLEERRTLTSADGELLRLYAIAHDRHEQANKQVESEGLIVSRERTGKDGQVYMVEEENKYLKIVERSERTMLAILSQLGLSPASRDRVKITRGNDSSEEGDLVEMHISMVKDRIVAIPVEPRNPL